MHEPYTLRGVAVIAWPALATTVLLMLAPWWGAAQPAAATPAPWILALLALTAAAAGSYLPYGAGTLGLAAVALPAALLHLSPVAAGLFGGGVFLLREGLRRLLLPGELPRWERTSLVRVAAATGRVALAGCAAGFVALLAGLSGGSLGWHLAAAGTFVVVEGALCATAAVWGPPPRRPLDVLRARLSLDTAGWLLGAATATAAAAVGWLLGLLPLVGVAVLAAELARNAHRRRLAVARIRDLHEVSLAGQRIVDGTGDLTAVAAQVFAECRRVLDFGWFQLEMREHDGSVRTWRARGRGALEEGEADPELSPPALPGIHRRAGWRVLVRELTDDQELLARLRLWCDPRRLEPTSVELLDALLPQIAISVRQALTERQARRDHLTGLPDRRVLEARLEEAYRSSRADGSSMAVVMCDIDRFKRINDRYGHAAGDGALLKIAEVLESCRRDTDLCARYGGEEFAVVLQRGDGETALGVAERIRQAVGSTVFVHEGKRIPLRISAGVAAYPELYVDSGKELLLLADEALYEAKRRGRDRCLLHLGRRRYQLPGGKVVGEEEVPPEPEVPTLFA
ncbi:MAG: diguanylate cyclase [Thermoanaerobaculia bacterium]